MNYENIGKTFLQSWRGIEIKEEMDGQIGLARGILGVVVNNVETRARLWR